MKPRLFSTALAFLFLAIPVSLHSVEKEKCFLPDTVKFLSEVPSPDHYLGFSVGDRHVSHDLLVGYFQDLAEKSPRVMIEEYGSTHEGRPLILAVISSESNIKKIKELKKSHREISDPILSANINTSDQPVVVWLSHSIHGNEASGANSSMLTGYLYAAGTGDEIEKILESTIILIDPSTNPDGLQRFSTWVNAHKSYRGNSDPLSREHNESWPGGRTNHYWFDLNRDWLPIEQPESEFRVTKLLEWKPNVLVDLHEMGSNSTFHFSPGEPSRVYPLIPEKNQVLTKKLAEGYAKTFNSIGSFYFSSEQFDDYYIGRGPTFLDINGGVSLLFEQASARGFSQETENGLLTFEFAIRNQFNGAVSTVRTASLLRHEFIDYQRDYYVLALSEARKNPKKAYVFGSETDRSTTYRLAEFLTTHGIEVYKLKKNISSSKNLFKASSAFIVPLEQPQYRLVESIFECRKSFVDSMFYDASAWNIPLAYGLPYEELDSKSFSSEFLGQRYTKGEKPSSGIAGTGTSYAFAIGWGDYNAPAALFKLLENDVIVKVATAPVETKEGMRFERGSLIIPAGSINRDTVRVQAILGEIIKEFGLPVTRLNSGDNVLTDLGSPSLVRVEKPKILILTEEGVNGISAGQLWHLFDFRYHIPVTLLSMRLLTSVDLHKYNVLILPDGNYQNIDPATVDKIKTWLASGNLLIGLERSANWLSKEQFIKAEFKPYIPSTFGQNYEHTLMSEASREVPGTIFNAKLDLTHPMNYGFTQESIAIYKDNDIIQNVTDMNPSNYPAVFTSSALIAGYSPRGFTDLLAGSPVYSVSGYRQGRVVVFYNNPNFRGYWRGNNRFIANAIFFSKAIRFTGSH